MFEINRILKVPPQAEIRKDLRRRVRLFISENRISPPSSLHILQKSAGNIIQQSGLQEEMLNFTMVLLGNEIWRETVMSTPFHRRLLLLPQCLRNDNQCQGVFDELGLICAGCQGCQIDSILNRAEMLGYTTLVAEGTTVAIGLVEEGAIDAVIGVSCMSVLQRSFEPVTRAAVPAIGIPLLGDGCSNTTLDYGWLFEEMENFDGLSENTPLSVSLLKNQVAGYFQPPVLNSRFNAENDTEKLALKMMGMGGQRIRPLLAVLAYQAYSGDISETIQQNLALIIECFHKASLIHDDIEDDEESRYGKPVLHRTNGIPVAINVGDYLLGKGYRMLAQTGLKPEVLAECLTVVAESHVKLAEGQGADISLNDRITEKTPEDMLQIFRLKTGEAVKVALLSGAIAGEAPEAEKKYLSKFAELFGIAYQIRDDLNEFREENHSASLLDFPFLISLLQEKMKMIDHELPRILSENNHFLFRRNAEKFDIEHLTEQFLQNYVGRCYAELDKLNNQKMRLGLYSVTGKVFKEHHRGQ